MVVRLAFKPRPFPLEVIKEVGAQARCDPLRFIHVPPSKYDEG